MKAITTTWQSKVDSIDLTFLLVLLGGERRENRLGKKEQQHQCGGNPAAAFVRLGQEFKCYM